MAHPRTRARLLLGVISLLVLVALLFALYGRGGSSGGHAAVFGNRWGLPDLLWDSGGAASGWALVFVATGLPAIAVMRGASKRAVYILLLASVATLALYGCGAAGGGRGALGWLLGPTSHPGPAGGDAGDGVPGVWGGLGRSISTTAGQIRWWFGLGGFACFGLGVYRAIRLDWIDAAKCLAAAIGLGIVGSIVGALFEGLAWLAVIVAGVAGVLITVQWGRGKSVFGHSWKCVLRVLHTGRDRHGADEPPEVAE